MCSLEKEWTRADEDYECSVAFQTPWFDIINRGGYFSLEYGVPQVVVLPIVNNNNVLMIRVVRPLIQDKPWELPAGGAEKTETTLETARREFHEETGIAISDLNRFREMPLLSELPGRSPELLVCYQIHISSQEFNQRGKFDSEVAKIELFDFMTLKEKIVNGEIYLSSVIAVLARFLLQKGL